MLPNMPGQITDSPQVERHNLDISDEDDYQQKYEENSKFNTSPKSKQFEGGAIDPVVISSEDLHSPGGKNNNSSMMESLNKKDYSPQSSITPS